ncbi:cell division protein FtsZ [Bacteriovorax sp. Seq25_V]|uniref:cell division protein FtsZ n=1 Tax=Bacteriovorax sp. Seq25_V TaxID=1201288 RepID=UPI000389E570|nr:cell division protein FtsZ [Bacteriovorax sp. Seq25_V]EQC43322.1 cell division protein FtsZ [Bacteriovorax sp. Seq25_V]
MFEISDKAGETVTTGAKIRVVGVGGGGCNAVNTMIKAGLTGVEYIVANTDAQALNASLAPTKIQLGVELTKGLGAGANPEVGRKAALDEYEMLSEILEGSDMVFITAGMGGGTGTGAAPVIAKLAKELGALTVGVVTKPFTFEGKKRMRQAATGISTLEESVDSLITIPNQRLLYLAGESLSLVETFKKADEVLLNAVRGISDLINTTGHINADFADVSTVMANKGLALMGTGLCNGPDRAIKAATEAISSPLLEDISIDGATGIIINITGDESMTMHEVNEAVTLIMEAADDDAEIIFGSVIDNNLEDNIKVTVVATGLGGAIRNETFASRPVATAPARSVETVQMQAPERHVAVETPVQRTQQVETVEQNWESSPIYRTAPQQTVVEQQPMHHEEVAAAPAQQSQAQLHEDRMFDGGEAPKTGLADSIREAATRYETSKKEVDTAWNADPYASHSRERATDKTATRTRSIAEKLGFINFDEDELDTPSYLRKEEDETHSNHQRSEVNRSIDL